MKSQVKYNGRMRKVHQGSRGGYYVISAGRKVYLKTTAKKGNSRVEVDVQICTKTGSVIALKTLARAQFRGLGFQSTGLSAGGTSL